MANHHAITRDELLRRLYWTIRGAGCVVATEGASPWIVVVPFAGARADTIPIPVPDLDPPDGAA